MAAACFCAMTQDPLNVLWVEPHFPGRLGAVADWLVRRRGYRSWFYCHTADAREHWPASVGQGLNVQVFGVGGVARRAGRGLVSYARTQPLLRLRLLGSPRGKAAPAHRPDRRPLRRARLDPLRPRVCARRRLVVNLFDYYYHPRQNDLAEETGAGSSPGVHPLAAVGGRHGPARPRAMRPGLDSHPLAAPPLPRRIPRRSLGSARRGRRAAVGRTCPTPEITRAGGRSPAELFPRERASSRFVARSLDRLRGFDRFWQAAAGLLAARANVICVVVGDPVVQRGLDIAFHNQDYLTHLRATLPPVDDDRLWFLGRAAPGVVAEVLAASDLHLALGRPYPVARSVLEAMGHGCVVLASDTQPHREIISHGQTGLLADAADPEAIIRQALPVLDDPAAHRPLGQAAAELVRARYARDVCLPAIAERFSTLVAGK